MLWNVDGWPSIEDRGGLAGLVDDYGHHGTSGALRVVVIYINLYLFISLYRQ